MSTFNMLDILSTILMQFCSQFEIKYKNLALILLCNGMKDAPAIRERFGKHKVCLSPMMSRLGVV